MRTTGILLAAGLSRRFGANKLLAQVNGETVIRRSALNLVGARLDEVVVVLGHESEHVQSEIADLPVRFTVNARHAEGMATSLVHGVEVAGLADGYLIALGDMPFVPTSHFQRLSSLAAQSRPLIVASSGTGGEAEPPMWFSSQLRSDLLQLQGDRGARDIVRRFASQVVMLEADSDWLRDCDHPGG